jgi:hypothetical protein
LILLTIKGENSCLSIKMKLVKKKKKSTATNKEMKETGKMVSLKISVG